MSVQGVRLLLADKNVHSDISKYLIRCGHQLVRLEDTRLPNNADDPEVAAFAKRRGRIVLTADEAFTKILPSDLRKPGISLTGTTLTVDTPTIRSTFQVKCIGGERYITGTGTESHNGVVVYQNKYLISYHPHQVATLIDTYLCRNSKNYIESRVNDVCP